MTINGAPISFTMTDLVAIYGAALATYTYVSDRKRREFVARVDMGLGFIAAGGRATDFIILSASNPGERSLVIGGYGLLLPSGKQLVFPRPNIEFSLPHELQPGGQIRAFIDPRELAMDLHQAGYTGKIKLRGFFRDQLDNRFLSKKMEFSVSGWLNRPR